MDIFDIDISEYRSVTITDFRYTAVNREKGLFKAMFGRDIKNGSPMSKRAAIAL
jgi:hypothetical protein